MPDLLVELEAAAVALDAFYQLTRRADGRCACLIGTLRRGWEGRGETAAEAITDALRQLPRPASEFPRRTAQAKGVL